jgi:nicotinamide riboside transporter PnuC
MEELSIFFTIIAVIGAVLNSYQRIEGFYFWAFSNSFFVLFNMHHKHYSMVVLFCIYLVISINGIYNMLVKGD